MKEFEAFDLGDMYIVFQTEVPTLLNIFITNDESQLIRNKSQRN